MPSAGIAFAAYTLRDRQVKFHRSQFGSALCNSKHQVSAASSTVTARGSLQGQLIPKAQGIHGAGGIDLASAIMLRQAGPPSHVQLSSALSAQVPTLARST